MVDAHDVETVVDSLYALAPNEFVGHRNELAKALRSDKRRDDAARVAKLVKPTAAAWALNQIARRRPDLVDALLTKGIQLRQVQDRVLGGQAEAALLLSAAEERRRAIRDVVGAMSEALDAGEARRPDEWVRTLEAASVDDRLGELLRIGRFTTVVLEGVGFDGLLAGSDPRPRHLSAVPPLPDNGDDGNETSQVESAQTQATAATAEAARAEAARADAAREAATRVAAADHALRVEQAEHVEAEATTREAAARRAYEQTVTASRQLEQGIADAEEALANRRRDLESMRLRQAMEEHLLGEAVAALEAAKAERHAAEAVSPSSPRPTPPSGC